jgi:hypothetical protein
MKKFIEKMLSASEDVSHKRVIVVLFAISILSFCYIATYTNHVIPEFMFDGLALISGGGMGLTAVESIFNRKKNKNNTDETPPSE